MLRDLVRKYRVDGALILALMLAATVAAIGWHGALKPHTRELTTVAPLVFSGTIVLLLAAVASRRRGRVLGGWVQRILVDIALIAVFVPAAFLKVETFAAPFELIAQTDVPTVVARIATDQDFDRYRAWARIMTMSREQKDDVARGLAGLLVGDDAAARHSADMTLEIMLRRNTLTVLAALAPELRAYLQSGEGAPEPTAKDLQAAAYARHFVQNNYTAIRKALAEENRESLPQGGLAALMLALGTDDEVGHLFLREINASDDPTLQPLAAEVVKLPRAAKAAAAG